MATYKPRPRSNGSPDSQPARDRCFTPIYAIEPLLPFLHAGSTIWEPACGDGRMARFFQSHGFQVICSDIDCSLMQGPATEANFLTWKPDQPFDYIITNPPYSHPALAHFLARCYALQVPHALLIKAEYAGNASHQKLARKYGAEYNWLSQRVDFCMPVKGDKDSQATFPTYWHSWKINSKPVDYWSIVKRDDRQLTLPGITL